MAVKTIKFRQDSVVEFFRKTYKNDADQVIAESAVVDLVRQKKMSAMTGADVLGMHLTEFVEVMARHGVPYFSEPVRDPEESFRHWQNEHAGSRP